MAHKILYIAHTSYLGGGEINLFELIKRLNRDSFFPLVVVPFQGPLADKLRKIDVQVRIIPLVESLRRWPVSFLSATLKLARIIKEENIALVHANSIKNGEQSLFAALLAGVPCIWHVHNLISLIGAGKMRRIVSKKAKQMIAVSDAVRRDLINTLKIPEEKVVRIYNGIDSQEYRPDISGENFRDEFKLGSIKLVGMVGRLSPEKGHEVFLHAVKEISNFYPNAKFVITGESKIGPAGYGATLLGLARDLRIQDRIIFTGFRSDIPKIMAALDLLAVPSVAEPFGRVIIEAMAMQKPVVATNSGGAPEILSEGGGIIIDPNSPQQLTKAIVRILENQQLSQDLGQKGREIVLAKFDIIRHVAEIENVYRKILIPPLNKDCHKRDNGKY